jgi:hypothetical protein
MVWRSSCNDIVHQTKIYDGLHHGFETFKEAVWIKTLHEHWQALCHGLAKSGLKVAESLEAASGFQTLFFKLVHHCILDKSNGRWHI